MEGFNINISQEGFLKKFNFESDILEKNNINWDTLIDIYNDFQSSKEVLDEYANLIAGILRKQSKVHTVRTRIKDAEHLIAKLIRKTPDRREKYNSDFEFTVGNYKDEITDLIGVRVIHIFKEDWLDIHNFILGNWIVRESQANIREGDNREDYTNYGIEINPRETGYRSVHYLIEFMPTNQKITAEVQVRTIFEEGYGEIDHQLSYPNNNVPNVLMLNLLMLNRLAGSADEMASTVKLIKAEWGQMQQSLFTKDQEIEQLKIKVNSLDIQQEQKDSLVKDLDKVKINNTLKSIYIDEPKIGSYISSYKIDDSIFKGLTSSVDSLKIDGSVFKGLTSSVDSLKIDDSVFKGLTSSVDSLKIDDSVFKGLTSSIDSLKIDDSVLKGLTSTPKDELKINETSNFNKESKLTEEDSEKE